MSELARTRALEALRALHASVDAAAARLAEAHGDRLRCRRGCSACCLDGLTVFEVEAERLRRDHAELLATERPHPEGACAFLDDEGACRAYDARPYRCRTQGLPLRWIAEDADGRPADHRDVCELNEEGGPPVEELPASLCWTIGPVESRLAGLARDFAGGPPGRIELRSLFLERA